MNKLIGLVEELKNELDNSIEVRELVELKNEIKKDSELLDLLDKYHSTNDIKVKEEILSNELFCRFKDKEININILIMKINNELKKIKGDKNCDI